jgi:uncharacterized membrane protein
MLLLLSLIAGAVFLAAMGESPLVGGAIGLLLAWVYNLTQRIAQLESAQRQAAPATPLATTVVHSTPPPIPQRQPTPQSIPQAVLPKVAVTNPLPLEGNIVDKAFASAWGWLIGGNPFVRAGIALLFFGVVFLLRYSLEQNLIPIELRLGAATGGAIALLAYGWKLRERQGAYGLILQAGGIGLLYLTVFGAFSLYHLLPAVPAFALLVLVVAGAATLAVLQNSLSLAAFATVGGFLAPLLTPTGSNNYIGLFSFYAILNAGIVGIAWFKSWRVLNLLGFAFTFVIAALWGWHNYQPENFASIEPFLSVFFLFYVAIAVLFATRTPVSFKDKVDSTLVFGTPLLGFGMQVALVRDFEYGTAISAVVLGAFYLLLSGGLWKQLGKQQQLLVETFLVLGVIFTTLAIPFAVDGVVTSTAWAIEGAGMLWVSIRQPQWLRRAFAILLQYAALVALLWGMATDPLPLTAVAFFNGHFLAMLLITAAMLAASRLLSTDYAGKRGFEAPAAMALLLTAMAFLSLLFEVQIERFGLYAHIASLHLGYAALVAGLLLIAGQFSYWALLRYVLLLPLLLMGMALVRVIGLADSLTVDHGWLLWPLAFAGMYAVLFLYQRRAWFAGWLAFMHVALLWLVTLLLSHEVPTQLLKHFDPLNAWYIASLPLVGLAVIWWVMRSKFWPVRDYASVLQQYVVMPLVGLMGLWVLLSLRSSGDASPLPWMPLLNPLDVVMALLGATLWALYQQTRLAGLPAYAQTLRYAGTATAFIWLNTVVLRAQHHWNGLAWEFPDLLTNPSTQTALAIVWTLAGMALAWRGNRIGNRKLWVAGALLLGMVVLKLFVVDFASSGTLARIVSFLSVGVLLLFIGYLAPLPPEDKPARP